jgi:hypothetical protein
VPVVERDGPDAAQPAQHPGAFGPEHPAQFGDAQWQLAVGPAACREHQRVVRAQAGPQHQLVVRGHPHRREHVLAEVLGMTGQLEQLPFAQRRGHDVLISGAPLAFVHVLLDGVPGRGAGRQPDRQSGAGQRVGEEQLELAAQLAVVDHDGLLGGCTARAGSPGTRQARGNRPGPG